MSITDCNFPSISSSELPFIPIASKEESVSHRVTDCRGGVTDSKLLIAVLGEEEYRLLELVETVLESLVARLFNLLVFSK